MGGLTEQLEKLRELREASGATLESLLEVREGHSVNLEGSVQARRDILGILKRGYISEVEEEDKNDRSRNSSPSLLEGTIEKDYDHSNCHDCSCVPELTTHCVNHFEK